MVYYFKKLLSNDHENIFQSRAAQAIKKPAFLRVKISSVMVGQVCYSSTASKKTLRIAEACFCLLGGSDIQSSISPGSIPEVERSLPKTI